MSKQNLPSEFCFLQDLEAETGARKSLDTNIVDWGPHNNTNMLRFTRQYNYVNNFHNDGGPSYSPTACTGRWFEERCDEKFRSGFHARELGLQKIYMTEHQARFKPPDHKVRISLFCRRVGTRRSFTC